MFKKVAFTLITSIICVGSMAQTADDSGISAGFFDSSEEKDINFSTFKLPPLAVLFENAKQNPTILQYAKMQEIAQAEVVKQKKHIFSYISGNASASYGLSDIWSGSQGTGYGSGMVWQPHSSEQSYWNVGVNVSVPLEDLLDLGHSVKRKRLEVENAQIQKDAAYDQLKLQIITLYIRITNEVEFHHGNMEIESYARTGQLGQGSVDTYQNLLTQITTDIVTLEILTHTPIITNTTTDITLDSTIEKSRRQIAKENKAVEKRIRKAAKEDEKLEKKLIKQEEKEKEKAAKEEKEKENAAKEEKKADDSAKQK